jgi:N-acetylneuraminic acid mutarotase
MVWGKIMSKTVALLFVLVFLIASCVMVAKPVSSSAEVTGNSWVAKASMHEARGGLGVAVVNGKIYAIGGSTRSGGPQEYTGGVVGTNEEYDPETDTWTLKASMPTPRSNFRLEVVHNKIYCIGGAGGVNEVYDPATDTWKNRAPLLIPRESFSTVVFRDRIYAIGGIRGRACLGTTEVYDPVSDTWEKKASIPNASYHNPDACVVINGKIYVISGHGKIFKKSGSLESASFTYVYDEDTDSWTNKASMPVVKHGAGVVYDDKIYFIGSSYEDSVYVTLLQIYDPLTDTWSKGASPPQGGVNPGSMFATTGEMSLRRIYVVDDNLRIYDPEKNEWTLGPSKPTNRYSMGLAFLNDEIYAIGGITIISSTDLFAHPSSRYQTIITTYATNEVYTPVGYGTVPPIIDVVSPASQTYNESSFSLVFTVNKPVNWMGYSLDGQDNVTVTGNATISGLSRGLHNITVYAKDTFGNIGASETISFSVNVPFLTALVVAAVASVAIIGAVLAIYFKKRKS